MTSVFLSGICESLGHVVSGDGIQSDPDKIEKIKNWPKLNDSDKLTSFMAFAGYYLRFVKVLPN